MTKEPVRGFRAISLQQVINADREMWIQAAQSARGRPLSDPGKPLNKLLEAAFASPETSYRLLPFPASHSKEPAGSASDKPKSDRPKRPFKGGSSQPAKKGKGNNKGISLPDNCVAETGAGQRICFQFNRKRCNNQEKDKCHRGLHVCWLKSSGGKHPHSDCPHASWQTAGIGAAGDQSAPEQSSPAFCYNGLKVQLPQSPDAVDFSCSTQELVCVEIFAGCAQLSSSLRSSGFSVLPIDHKKGKMSKAKLTLLDLTKQHDFDVLLSILTTANIAYCHCAPVCGTGSRAREIPLPKGMEHVRAEPLRSQEFPLGLPHLVGKDLARVTAANMLYFVTLIACFLASSPQVMHISGWPHSALLNVFLFWRMRGLRWKLYTFNLVPMAGKGIHGHAGMELLAFLSHWGPCVHTHTHDKSAWRPYLTSQGNVIFPTSEEAAYPEPLCRKVAQLVLHFSCARGAQAPNDAFLPQGMTNEQRTGRKHGISLLPPEVAENKTVTDQLPPSAAEFRQISSLPAGRKTGCEVALGIRGTEIQISGDYKVGDVLYGIYRAPDEFIQAALQARHPIDYASSIPEVLIKNVAKVLSEGPKLVIARRKLALMKIKRRALRLQDEETKLHEPLSPELAGLLKGKNLLLWKELMEQTGFQDPQLFDELTQGFHLVGQATYSPAFPRGYVPMQQTPEELKRKAIWMRKADEAKCKSTGRPELDLLVWNQTLEECEKGRDWLATRRFPLEQKDKVRLIDDALSSGLNSAYGTSNKLTLFDVDALVSLILQIAGALQNSERGLPLISGEVVKFQLSQQWGGVFFLSRSHVGFAVCLQAIGPVHGWCLEQGYHGVWSQSGCAAILCLFCTYVW